MVQAVHSESKLKLCKYIGGFAKTGDPAKVFLFMVWLQFAQLDEKHRDRPAQQNWKFLTYEFLIIVAVKALYYYIALVAVY